MTTAHVLPTAVTPPTGAVYGVLMNTESEWQALATAMLQPPYNAAPQAPVLYIKTANTYSPSASVLRLPPDVQQVAIGATVSMGFGPVAGVFTAQQAINSIAYWRLMLDVCVPHTSFFRPPVRHHCRDGFLGLGQPVPGGATAAPPALDLRINGRSVPTIDWSQLKRSPAQLVQDVCEFQQLGPGDELMLGCVFHKPLVGPGDRVELLAPGHAPLVLSLERAV